MTAPQNFGPRPQLTWLPVANLGVSADYQRSLETSASKRLIGKIAQDFRWSAFGTILATPDGFERWLIIDGQHRVEGAKAVGISTVPAVVIEEANTQEQAQAFVRANKDRVPMSAQALYHARVLAGDPAALTIARICAEARIAVIRFHKAAKQVPVGKTAAVPALLQMLRSHGEDVTRRAVMAVVEIYGNEQGALRGPFFLAAARFLAEGGGDEGLKLALQLVGWKGLEAAGYGLGTAAMVVDMLALLNNALKPAAGKTPPPAPVAAPKPSALPAPKNPPPNPPPLAGRAVESAPAAPRSAVAASPAPAAKRRDDDQDAIAKFLAEKGAKIVMAPELVAQLLRDAGHQVTIREAEKAIKLPSGLWYRSRTPIIDGQESTLADLCAAANALRTKAGLPELSVPAEGVAA